MPWPLSQDYNEEVQNPGTSFADPELRSAQAALNALGVPLPRSGNFADVYEFRGPGNARWAVKCFTREVWGVRERYAAISQHLARAQLPFTVSFQFLEQGVRVRGQWFPVVKMEWVEGYLLNEFVRGNLLNPPVLLALGLLWRKMGKWLSRARIAHADLQHGNVILVPGNNADTLSLRLIDYDGMWVPALAKVPSREFGHSSYQHPKRLAQGIYSPEADRVPLLLVACALRALAVRGEPLWKRYDNGDNLLFTRADLSSPGESALFRELWQIYDAGVHDLVGYLALGLAGPFAEVPLLSHVTPSNGTRTLTPAQEQQAAALLHSAPRTIRVMPAGYTAPATQAGIIEPGTNANLSLPSPSLVDTLPDIAPLDAEKPALLLEVVNPLRREGRRRGRQWSLPLAAGLFFALGLISLILVLAFLANSSNEGHTVARHKRAQPSDLFIGPEERAKLEVLCAIAGGDATWQDVTRKAQGLVKGTRLVLTTEKLGFAPGIDFVPSRHKAFILVYRYGDKLYWSAAPWEGQVRVDADALPPRPEVPAPVPGQRVAVLFALYGAHGTWRDFGPQVQAKIKGGQLALGVRECGLPDIAVNKYKTLVLVYRVAKDVRVTWVNEKGRISVPALAP
jgi:hypothetical protein